MNASIPDLFETREFLRVDVSCDNFLIQACIDAAAESVRQFLDVDELPEAAPVKAAILLRVGDLYESRTATSHKPLLMNPTFERLLWPYRKVSA